MTNLLLAMARGAWMRVHGLISNVAGTLSNVINLIAGHPTNILLTEEAAGELLNWATQSREAANQWFNGEQPRNIPSVPVNKAISLEVDPGDTGPTFQFGIVLKTSPEIHTVAVLETKQLPSVQEMIERLQEWAYSGHATGTQAAAALEFAKGLLYSPRETMVPLWLVKRVT